MINWKKYNNLPAFDGKPERESLRAYKNVFFWYLQLSVFAAKTTSRPFVLDSVSLSLSLSRLTFPDSLDSEDLDQPDPGDISLF